MREHSILADEAARLVQRDREAEARFKHGVSVVDVVPVVAVGLFHPQAAQRLQAGMAQAEFAARRYQPVVDVHRLLSRNVQLVAQFAQVGDPDAQHPGEPDVDVPGSAEPECRVADVSPGDRRQQRARARALDVDLRVGRGYVRDERMSITCGELPPHPGQRMPVRGVGGDDVEIVVVELGDGEVGLELARRRSATGCR